jgi:hypothetical protein
MQMNVVAISHVVRDIMKRRWRQQVRVRNEGTMAIGYQVFRKSVCL